MLAIASACIVPAVEQWGVLVTNSGAATVTLLGALYVLRLIIHLPRFLERLNVLYHLLQGTLDNNPFRRGATSIRRRRLLHHR